MNSFALIAVVAAAAASTAAAAASDASCLTGTGQIFPFACPNIKIQWNKGLGFHCVVTPASTGRFSFKAQATVDAFTNHVSLGCVRACKAAGGFTAERLGGCDKVQWEFAGALAVSGAVSSVKGFAPLAQLGAAPFPTNTALRDGTPALKDARDVDVAWTDVQYSLVVKGAAQLTSLEGLGNLAGVAPGALFIVNNPRLSLADFGKGGVVFSRTGNRWNTNVGLGTFTASAGTLTEERGDKAEKAAWNYADGVRWPAVTVWGNQPADFEAVLPTGQHGMCPTRPQAERLLTMGAADCYVDRPKPGQPYKNTDTTYKAWIDPKTNCPTAGWTVNCDAVRRNTAHGDYTYQNPHPSGGVKWGSYDGEWSCRREANFGWVVPPAGTPTNVPMYLNTVNICPMEGKKVALGDDGKPLFATCGYTGPGDTTPTKCTAGGRCCGPIDLGMCAASEAMCKKARDCESGNEWNCRRRVKQKLAEPRYASQHADGTWVRDVSWRTTVDNTPCVGIHDNCKIGTDTTPPKPITPKPKPNDTPKPKPTNGGGGGGSSGTIATGTIAAVVVASVAVVGIGFYVYNKQQTANQEGGGVPVADPAAAAPAEDKSSLELAAV